MAEKEVRIKINNVKAFKKKIKALGAECTMKYSFMDYVCEPKQKNWNPHFINLKIRHQLTGDKSGIIELSFHQVRWNKKVKVTKLGFKSKLEIPKSNINSFIDLMGWKKLVAYSRTGEHYKLKNHQFTLEKINHLGYLVEVENSTVAELNETIKLLGEEKNIVKKTIPEMVLEELNK
ncbi:hypothetical protein KKC32_03925 [Patescibacteria group bacterium]|nr:hypothetical protein [Patescibacteria group bacterium]